jgi:hypothetical protein
MRSAVVLLSLTLASPASAWEFSPIPICTLRHDENGGSVTLTWDPSRAEAYAIALSRGEAWPEGAVFAISFDGPRALSISTERHVISDGGTTLTVTDRGFGNVLDGLEFNDRAVADLAGTQVSFSLAGAAGPVRDFRACTSAAVASARPAGTGALRG